MRNLHLSGRGSRLSLRRACELRAEFRAHRLAALACFPHQSACFRPAKASRRSGGEIDAGKARFERKAQAEVRLQVQKKVETEAQAESESAAERQKTEEGEGAEKIEITALNRPVAGILEKAFSPHYLLPMRIAHPSRWDRKERPSPKPFFTQRRESPPFRRWHRRSNRPGNSQVTGPAPSQHSEERPHGPPKEQALRL